MKVKLPSIIYLVLLSVLINACSKGCPDSKPIEKGVDKSYLPYIIPYSDTSTHLFLKNGKDTLLFKSQGLKETKISESAGEGSCDKYSLQQYSLKMTASDTDFFEVKYFAIKTNVPKVQYICHNLETDKIDDSRYIYFFQLKQLNTLNYSYDSVSISDNKYGDTVYSNLKFGVLRVKDMNNVYELIK
ncbi:MAG: hypothetical protein JHD28_01645 [Bacteroidia bacterium]|nr:hypothetical protein [Bacteroidia bacterium]